MQSVRLLHRLPDRRNFMMIKTTVQVEGMMCGMCESHVNDAVRKACQVEKSHPPMEREKL